MADIEDALQEEITNNPTISANLGTRLFYDEIPQDVSSEPYGRYERISNTRDETLDGPSGYATARFHVDIFDADYKDARQVGKDIRKEFDGWRHDTIGTNNPIFVNRIKLVDIRNVQTDETTADFGVRVVLMIDFEEDL